jgi:hypothetical protein
VDPAWADVDAVHGEPEGSTALALLPPFVPPFVGGAEVGAYEGRIFAAEKCEAGVVVRLAAFGCVFTRDDTWRLGRDTYGARGGAVPAARGQ